MKDDIGSREWFARRADETAMVEINDHYQDVAKRLGWERVRDWWVELVTGGASIQELQCAARQARFGDRLVELRELRGASVQKSGGKRRRGTRTSPSKPGTARKSGRPLTSKEVAAVLRVNGVSDGEMESIVAGLPTDVVANVGFDRLEGEIGKAVENVELQQMTTGIADYYDVNTARGYAPGNGWGQLVRSTPEPTAAVEKDPVGTVLPHRSTPTDNWHPAPWPADLAPPGAEDVERRPSYLDEDRYQ